MQKYFLALAVLLSISALSLSKSFENSKDVVWFPNPSGDGLIPAYLVPQIGSEEAKLGNISDIHFYLYTRNSTNINPDEIFVGNTESIANSNFIAGGKVKLLIHGFGGSYLDGFPQNLLRELLKDEGNDNIICVEWSILADNSNYIMAVANAQLTSGLSAELLEFLISEGLVRREDIHLIGFSLGGQVVGQIGSRVNEKLTRITALDPALPLFDVADLYNRTDPSDAIFVDVIHTSARILGFHEPCGTVDFYPNGGQYQPGCDADLTGSCAHGRAPAMYAESVFSTVGFWGRECDSYEDYQNGLCSSNKTEQMGYHTPESARGVFYLESNAASPYAQGPV